MEQFLYADLLNYVLFFFSCSVMGWLMEVICKYKQFHRFINRGFLIGPYCPIYGFGAVCISILLTKYADSPSFVYAALHKIHAAENNSTIVLFF